ncbi:SDR family oxidoreductase [Longitalea luteola]|uniref:SDR family oxidoreductase n=1 Tax=Longitalea luteola TaxID=2812563 RepID=UPI001A958504|nr:aldehyde reductase [Longitalea luteola]
MNRKKVLLTGVTGFLGSHTTIQLLERGYQVIGTLRDKRKADTIRTIIGKHTKYIDALTIVEADLNEKEVWYDLTRDIDYVQHIASPFPREMPRHENDLIVPAKEGALNILTAASANNVKRVVITSSVAAIVYGKTKKELLTRVFNESDWTDESNLKDSTPYFKSKTIAEKAAWKFHGNDRSGLELTTVLPGAILGPVLEEDFGTSANIVIKMLDGSSPAIPRIGFDIVDVRSVADLLIKAMEMKEAANKRYIASAGYLTFKEVAMILKEQYPGRKIPSAQLPDFMVRLFSYFDASLKPILVDVGVKRKIDNTKAVRELGWKPLPVREAVISCAKTIFETGIVK